MPEEVRDLVEVEWPQGLTTTYSRQLDWRQEMQGQANIVVDDMRLLERIFYQLRRALSGAVGSAKDVAAARP